MVVYGSDNSIDGNFEQVTWCHGVYESAKVSVLSYVKVIYWQRVHIKLLKVFAILLF